MKPPIIQYDDLDTRREIHRLLQLVHPRTAVEWLDRQCQKVGREGSRPAPGRKMMPRLKAAIVRGGEMHYRLATEIYMDVWMLAAQYDLDIDDAARDLERLARGPNSRLAPCRFGALILPASASSEPCIL